MTFKYIVYTSGIGERGGVIKRDGEREDQLVGRGKRFERVRGWQIVRERNDP